MKPTIFILALLLSFVFVNAWDVTHQIQTTIDDEGNNEIVSFSLDFIESTSTLSFNIVLNCNQTKSVSSMKGTLSRFKIDNKIYKFTVTRIGTDKITIRADSTNYEIVRGNNNIDLNKDFVK